MSLSAIGRKHMHLCNHARRIEMGTIRGDAGRIAAVMKMQQSQPIEFEVRRLAGIHVPFFSVEALTQTAPAALARAARLPIHPVRVVARGRRYVVFADEPLQLAPELPRDEAMFDLLTRLNATYERWIREDSAQWAWHQMRWRTRPGERTAPPLHSRHLN